MSHKADVALRRIFHPRESQVIGLICCFALLTGAITSCTTDIGTVTVASILDGALKKVNDAIDHTAAEFQASAASTGSQIIALIDDAQVSYEDSLNKSINKIDRSVSATLDQIQSLADSFVANVTESIDEVLTHVQSIVLTLPLHDGSPQVRSWTPRYIANEAHVVVNVQGIYTQSQLRGSETFITVGNGQTKHYAEGAATQEQTFLLEAADFSSQGNDHINYTTLNLVVPYHSAIFKTDKTATFRLLVGRLAQSPGTIVVQRLTHQTVEQDRPPETSPSIHQGGVDHDVDQTYCTGDAPVDPQPGPRWRLKLFPNAAGPELFHLDSSAADESNPHDPRKEGVAWTKTYIDPTSSSRQCIEVTTKGYNTFQHSGDIHFHLAWVWEREVDQTSWTSLNPQVLSWTMQLPVLRDVAAQEWSVTFNDFQGDPPQVITKNYQSKWLNVTFEAGTVTIATPDPELLKS